MLQISSNNNKRKIEKIQKNDFVSYREENGTHVHIYASGSAESFCMLVLSSVCIYSLLQFKRISNCN